jgi:hypothetical protein
LLLVGIVIVSALAEAVEIVPIDLLRLGRGVGGSVLVMLGHGATVPVT